MSPYITGMVLSCLLFNAVASAQVPPEPPVFTALDGEMLDPSSEVHNFTGLPLTPDGWTDLHGMIMSEGYTDARIVYVSTSGNDSTGQAYSQNSATLGGRPLNPSGAIAPFRTLSAAYERLRVGYPDVMLLRRGDSWATTTLRVTKPGRSSSERMIFAAYGPENIPRPVVRQAHPDLGTRHLVMSSFHNVLGEATGVHFRGDNVLIEDFFWDSPNGATSEVVLPILNGGSSVYLGGGTVRRSAASWTVFFAGDWGGAPQTPSRFEENTISRSGLGTGYSNVYFSQGAANIQSFRNQSLLTGNAGFRQRHGGIVRENLTAGTQSGLAFGGGFDVQGALTFERNVGMHINGPHDIVGIQSGRINGNIFTAFNPGAAFTMTRFKDDHDGVHGGWNGATQVSDNVFYSAENPGAISWFGLQDALAPSASIVFSGNRLLKASGGQVLSVLNDARVTYQGQSYFSPSENSSWFSGRSFEQMIPSTGEATNLAAYPDPGRNMLTYMQSIGVSPSSVSQALEWYSDGVPGNPSLAGALANRRGAWDERFTAAAVINHVRQGFGLSAL